MITLLLLASCSDPLVQSRLTEALVALDNGEHQVRVIDSREAFTHSSALEKDVVVTVAAEGYRIISKVRSETSILGDPLDVVDARVFTRYETFLSSEPSEWNWINEYLYVEANLPEPFAVQQTQVSMGAYLLSSIHTPHSRAGAGYHVLKGHVRFRTFNRE